MEKLNMKIIRFIPLLVIIGLCLIAYFRPRQPTPINNLIQKTFFSKSECESQTGRKCRFITCDYIPAGKTQDEVCGKGFVEGWQ